MHPRCGCTTGKSSPLLRDVLRLVGALEDGDFELFERAVLDLADALLGDAELLAELLFKLSNQILKIFFENTPDLRWVAVLLAKEAPVQAPEGVGTPGDALVQDAPAAPAASPPSSAEVV